VSIFIIRSAASSARASRNANVLPKPPSELSFAQSRLLPEVSQRDLSSILACAYKGNRKHLDFSIENGEVRVSALTPRLGRVGSLGDDL
jgi:hypothetical protein